MSSNSLFTPFALKSLTLKNRVVMAPMTREFSPGGVPGPDVAAYYRRRAEGQVGLIFSEGTVIERPAASNSPRVPHFYGAEALAGWQHVIDEVHQAGGKMGPQLWHMGAVGPHYSGQYETGEQEGPSGLLKPGTPGGRAMTTADIEATIAAFGQAAAAAQRLGFDCLELHGAHGYLIDQFFWAALNERTDTYGGPTLAERSRLAVELVREVRRRVGPGLCDQPAPLAVEAAGLRRQAGPLAPRNGSLARPAGRGGRGYFPLLAAPVLGARVCRRRLGPELRWLGEEAHRHGHHHGRLGGPEQ